MHDWKSKVERKKRKGNQTPGRQKCATCQADYLKKYFAKSSRSYKHPGYRTWLNNVRVWNNEK